jgi:uncharacterized membrane protein
VDGEANGNVEPLVGPIQLVVIGFDREARFSGEIIRALSEVRGHGVVRLIDALFVRKDEQGRINAMMRESDLSQEQREALGAIAGGLIGYIVGGEEGAAEAAAEATLKVADNAFGLGLADLQNIQERVKPGHAALVLLVEHVWAKELKGAVRGAGGVPLVQGFLTEDALVMVGAELRTIVEAENAIAVAEAAKGAAILDALATMEAMEEVKQAAVAEAAQVLLAAGLIEAEAVQDVIDTLVMADLIKREAVAEAAAAVKEMDAKVQDLKAAQSASDQAETVEIKQPVAQTTGAT